MKKTIVLAVAVLLGLATVGCSKSDSKDETSTANTSGESSTDATERSSRTTEDSGDSGDSGDSSDASLPDFGDGQLGDCLNVSLTYAGIYLGALGLTSDEDRAELERTLEQLKGEVPPEIQDDMETIAKGVTSASNLVELGEFFDTDEYREADENITAYLDEECGTLSE